MKILFFCLISILLVNCSSNHIQKRSFSYPDCNSVDIEMMDTCLIGMKLKDALLKLRADSSQLMILDEPPGYFNQVRISALDSIKIRIYTKGLLLMDTLTGIIPYPVSKSILNNETVIGVSWLKPLKKKNGHKGIGVLYWEHEIRD